MPNGNDKNGSTVKAREESIYKMSEMQRSTKLYLIAFVIIIVLMVGIYAYNFLFDDTFLPRIVLEWIIIPIRNIGFWGILLFFGLMVLQSIIAPIPSEMVLLASGLIWGIAGGAIIGFIGSMISAMIAYYIAYRGGRPLAVGILGEKTTRSMEYYMSKYGFTLIFVMRAAPMVPYDLFTTIGGFTQMEIKKYTVATALGTPFRTVFYAFIGTTLAADVDSFIATLYPGGVYNPSAWEYFENTAYNSQFNIYLLIIIGIVGAGFLVFYFVIFPHMKKAYEKVEMESQNSSVPSELFTKKPPMHYLRNQHPLRFSKRF